MKSIRNFFGVGPELFEADPELIWRQSAPLYGDLLAFNQPRSQELDKIEGGLLLSPSFIEGLQLTYKTDRKVRGFIVGKDEVVTEPFDTIILQDYVDGVGLLIANGNIVIPSQLTREQEKLVGSLFAAAVCAKFQYQEEERKRAIENLLT